MKDSPERELPPGLTLAWGLASTARRRGPKPAHSVERIVEAAVEIADRDGLAALSMPKIAGSLGITANALYRYVSSKEELLVLLAEAGWGPPSSALCHVTGWREAATEWTHAAVERLRAHPWLLDLPVRGTPLTPNLLGWLEVLLEAMSGSGLDDQEILGCALLLDGYARSTADLARTMDVLGAPPALPPTVIEFLRPLLNERGFPRLAAMMAGGNYEVNDFTDSDIEFGLNRIIAGIDALIDTKRGKPEDPKA
ncbi:TetR/AcrR family transcriptional regulator [Spongiactinospora rosea]|uniref:TetR/AcrR family transcriptional regulator n=1 Tax=Spongiactinospora rosea TaxID=2248750 RepID=A0A366LPK9_9ACTN|nr:TetR/AcrR family transcriptional regulator [Spongiactinospora rosea]RBQ15112.1 TetR/AcrR family transcriptional regulator [Spongiactinospora rosea]